MQAANWQAPAAVQVGRKESSAMEQGTMADHAPWPARAALLAVVGAVLGFLFDRALDGAGENPARLAAASFVATGGIVLALTLERVRWAWSIGFAVGCAAAVALIVYWNGSPEGWSAGNEWRMFSAFLAVAIAAPLFQSVRDEGGWKLGYAAVHSHAWTNIVMWFAGWAFVLIAFLLAFLLAELFNLIGVTLLRDDLRESAFAFALGGAAGGAASGLLRDRDKVLALLQRVVTTILSVLAPVLALGLILFVLALPFTGLRKLWDETSSTTPILLVAVAGAFLLANAVIGNAPEDEAKGRVLRWSAMTLGLVMTPLAVVAAVSTWLRIDQYGFTPERLWALVFLIVVVAVSGAYLWALLRGRLIWAERIRPLNVRIALALSMLALLLATPLIDFGAISTRDQLARLTSGRTSAERFDWAALRFDFGPSGRAALERLRDSGAAPLRARAAQVLAASDRGSIDEPRVAATLVDRLRVIPAPAELPPQLRDAVAGSSVCSFGQCTVYWEPGSLVAVAVGFPCKGCLVDAARLRLGDDGIWQARATQDQDLVAAQPVSLEEQRAAVERGEVEVRRVERRQVYVGGKPVAQPFE